MTPPRRIIRDAVAAALDASPLAAQLVEGHVWTSRAKPLDAKTVPAAIVYTPSEKREKGSGGGDNQGALIRELTVAIEIVDLADDDDDAALENRLDAYAQLVEAALDGFVVPGRLSDRMLYDGMDSDLYERGGHLYGAKLITYAVTYRTETRQADDASQDHAVPVRVTLDPDTGRAPLPAGTVTVTVPGYDQGLDYTVDRDRTPPELVRLPGGMLPSGASVAVTITLPRPAAAPTTVHLGQAPAIGRGHEDDYTQVAP